MEYVKTGNKKMIIGIWPVGRMSEPLGSLQGIQGAYDSSFANIRQCFPNRFSPLSLFHFSYYFPEC